MSSFLTWLLDSPYSIKNVLRLKLYTQLLQICQVTQIMAIELFITLYPKSTLNSSYFQSCLAPLLALNPNFWWVAVSILWDEQCQHINPCAPPPPLNFQIKQLSHFQWNLWYENALYRLRYLSCVSLSILLKLYKSKSKHTSKSNTRRHLNSSRLGRFSPDHKLLETG